MAENENIVLEEQPEVPAKPKKDRKAAAKEWFRKKIVSLKRAPHMIALICYLATTVYFMLVLFCFSQAIDKGANEISVAPATGICIFITTLLSLLVLVSYLNAFPKRKKPNIAFIILVFVMVAGMVGCDIGYYVQMTNLADRYVEVAKAQPYLIIHLVLLGISTVVFALLPVYKKLIQKIDTSVVLESATENMQGQIDIQED